MLEEEQNSCYLVEHPRKGTKVFYFGRVYKAEAAKAAVDYAENIVIVFKLPLHETEMFTQSLNAQFNAVAKPELPSIPTRELTYESMFESVG